MTIETNKSDFEALLGEITDMAKAFPAKGDTASDDKKIEGAADEGEANSDADKDGDKDGDKDVSKSFTLKLDDGTEIEAMDGAALFKALSDRVEKNEGTVLEAVRGLTDVVKSLVGQVTTLSAKPAGRKTVLAISEKTPAVGQDVNKSEPEGVKYEDFMAKALSLQAEGKLAGADVRRIEAYANRGLAIPAEIVRKVLA